MEAGPVKPWLGHRRSVTTINIHHQGGGCSVVVGEKSIVDEDSSAADAEVTNFTNDAVNLRHKKKDDEIIERPMSWEGELSDSQLATIKPEPNETSIEPNSVQIPSGTNDPSLTQSEDEKHHSAKYALDPINEKTAESLRSNNLSSQTELPLLVDKLLSNGVYCRSGPVATASPDSAVYSCYSPGASPVTSRHFLSSSSGISSPFTPSLSRNNSDASQYGGSNHSSCYSHSYSSVSVSPTQFSPTHSPIQGRHIQRTNFPSPVLSARTSSHNDFTNHDETIIVDDKISGDPLAHASPAISRQQLINSPCPICGDKISGFHYGIFSCESCKGFFKRTVQNRKNYVCLRGSSCPVSIATRKKCPACRFDKCLTMGMKLEAIREDRTRGGRSTYQCSYTVPPGLAEPKDTSQASHHNNIPTLLQEIMEVEHLWQYKESEGVSLPIPAQCNGSDPSANLCNIADHRLYKIVKWCKSLPLFKNISIDDQISLLINAWCELLLFSCCYRSMSSPGEIKVSLGKSISLGEARALGLAPPIERMLNFTDHLRRLRVDNYEYVAMKVILLLTSDTSELREPEKVRASQEKALQALQHYTLAHYPDIPSKFGELLLRIPELQRTCQVGKEMLSAKSKEGEGPSFNLLMELLRGDH